MRSADPTSKALVFTQYNSTLEWLKKALPAAGFGYRSISGSMPLNQRTKAIEVRLQKAHHTIAIHCTKQSNPTSVLASCTAALVHATHPEDQGV